MRCKLVLRLGLVLSAGPAPAIAIALALASAVRVSADDQTPEGWAREGAALLESQDFRGAASAFEKALVARPDDLGVRFGLGFAYFRLSDERRARAELERVIEAEPRHAAGLEVLGRLEYSLNRTEEALDLWRRALEADPDNAAVRELVAKAERELAVERDFRDEVTQHFRLKIDGTGSSVSEEVQRQVGALLEQAYQRIGYALGHYPEGEIAAILYADKSFYDATGMHGWVGGLYDGKIRLPAKGIFDEDPEELRRVVFHEYTHAAIHAIASDCPAWLHEGVAQHFEGKPLDDAPVRAALHAGHLPPVASLGSTFTAEREIERARLLYAEAHAFVAFLAREHGEAKITELLHELGEGKGLGDAFERVFGKELDALDAEWRAQVGE